MGQVVPFISRVRDSGDWSANERARLEALADQLGQAGVDVEVVFGATDEGDPWCVVTDADGEVLIHVARIGGVFVVHSAVDDAMSEGGDLHAALRERLAVTEDPVAPRSATILPFELRQAQTLLALVAAAAFFYETAGANEAQAAELPHAPSVPDETPPPVATHDHDTASQDREVIARGAALQAEETAPAATTPVAEAPAPAAAPIEAAPVLPAHLDAAPADTAKVAAVALAAPAAEAPPVVIQGTAGDDLLVGTAANEHILGGAGNDTLVGGGGHDTLDGGAGDDRIELGEGVVAIGGTGADTFVIRTPHGPGGPPPEGFFFGTILDFSHVQGDHVVNGQGMTVRLTPHPDGTTLTGPGGAVATFTTTSVLGHPVTRVDVDLNGDGVNDGYLLVGHPGAPPPGDPLGAPGGDHEPPPITVTGQSLPLDPFG